MLVDFGSHVDNVINDSFNYTVTKHRWNCQELKYIEFSVARLFMFLLIFNEQRVPKFFLSYLKFTLILTAIGWFIISIQSDLFWHRCLEREAFGTPRMYTLSPSKSIKGSNYGEFLKDKNVLLCTRLYKYAPNLESFAYTAICMRNVYTLIW